MLVKVYGTPEGKVGRYSPGECIGTEMRRVERRPIPTTSARHYAERSNLTIRMHTQRFRRC
jgi:hypothetical protein